MTGLVVLALLVTAGTAGAARLEAATGGAVTEASFRYQVHLDGVIARVTARQALRAEGGASEAVYTFALPADAAIVGLGVTLPGGDLSRGAPVDAAAAIVPAPDRDTVALVPDLALVRRLGVTDDGDVAYELRVYPVGADPTVVAVDWVAPLTYVDGRLGLRIPGRGEQVGLAAATGTVKVTAPAGVKKMADLHVDGAALAAKPGKQRWRFAVPAGDLRFDVAPVLGARAVVSFATAKVRGDTGALAVAVLRPRADQAVERFERAVIVVDTSTSAAGDGGLEALANVAEGVAAGLRGAALQVVTFDRDARAGLPDFAASSAETRAAIGAAIRAVTPRSGSDLAAGVDEARRLLGEQAAGALIVVVTDGVVSSELTPGDVASDRTSTISTALVVADDQPLPDPRAGLLADVAAGTGGHVIAMRRGDVAARAPKLAGQLAAAADWFVQELDAGDAEVALELPEAIPAGGGAIRFGWYRGGAPKRVAIVTPSARLAAKKVTIARAAALAIVVDPAPLLDDGTVAAAARRIGAVGSRVSLVAVDPGDALAVDRLALAARGGTFSRIPAPDEPDLAPPPPEGADEVVIASGTTTMIDVAARIRNDLLSPQLVPAARRCFQTTLGEGARRGRVGLEIEIAGDEVIGARAESSTAGAALLLCLRDAAYDLTVPSYTLADEPGVIHLIRYPIDFVGRKDQDPQVAFDDGDRTIDLGDAPKTPLGDLEE